MLYRTIWMPLLVVMMFWASTLKGQINNLSVGGGIGYNITPVMMLDYYDWSSDGIAGNLSPVVALRYGNKVSVVFKTSYIRNDFKQTFFSQYGGTSNEKFEANIHQIYFDLLFEHSPKGSKGFYYHLGPGFGIPVKVKLSDDFYQGAWGPNPATHSYEESFVPADFKLSIQGVIGLGGYIPVKEKNLISIECNFRIGLNKVLVNVDDYEEARMVAVQFILGYLRRLGE